MKNKSIRVFLAMMIAVLLLAGCKQEDISDYKQEELTNTTTEKETVSANLLFEPIYDSIFMSGDLIFVEKNTDLLHGEPLKILDERGKEIASVEYDSWSSCSNEGIIIIEKNGLYGLIDNKTGKEIVPLEYDYIEEFSEGLARVKKLGKYGFIDKKGKIVVPLQYDYAEEFSNSLAKVEIDGKYGVVDNKGKEVLPTIYDSLDLFLCEGMVRINDNDTYMFADKNGTIIGKYDDAELFNEGYAAVKQNEKWGAIDKSGKVVIPLEYDWMGSFISGIANVEKGGNWGIIDNTGKIVLPIEYDFYDIGSYIEGITEIRKDGKIGFVDKDKKIVILPEYDSIGSVSENLVQVEKDGKWGMVDKTGKEVLPIEYENVHNFYEGLAAVKKGSMSIVGVEKSEKRNR